MSVTPLAAQVAGSGGAVDITAFGATGSGTSDDSGSIQRALDSGAVDINIPALPKGHFYRIQKQLVVGKPMRIRGAKSMLKFDFPLSGVGNSALLAIRASHVTIEGLWFDGSNLPVKLGLENRIVLDVRGASSSERVTDVVIKNCDFTNLLQFNADDPVNHPEKTKARSWGIMLWWTDNSVIEDCTFYALTGPAVWAAGTNALKILRNHASETWTAAITLNAGNVGAEVAYNVLSGWGLSQPGMVFHGDPSNPSRLTQGNPVNYWGGAIDLMGQHSYRPDLGPDRNDFVHDNDISGRMLYGGAIRCGSVQHATITRNKIHDIDDAAPTEYIAVSTRTAPGIESSHRNTYSLTITDNDFRASGSSHVGIYLTNLSNGGLNIPPSAEVLIQNNRLTSFTKSVPITYVSGADRVTVTTAHPHGYYFGKVAAITGVNGCPSANGIWTITVTGPNTFTIPVKCDQAYRGGGISSSDEYFQQCIILHGQDRGWRDVTIADNVCSCRPVAGIVGGAVTLVASVPSGKVEHTKVVGNTITWFTTPRIDPPVIISGVSKSPDGSIRLTISPFPQGTRLGEAIKVNGLGSQADGVWRPVQVDSDHIDLKGSTFAGPYGRGARAQSAPPSSTMGIEVGQFTEDSLIEGNTVQGFGIGIWVDKQSGAEVMRSNTLRQNGSDVDGKRRQ